MPGHAGGKLITVQLQRAKRELNQTKCVWGSLVLKLSDLCMLELGT